MSENEGKMEQENLFYFSCTYFVICFLFKFDLYDHAISQCFYVLYIGANIIFKRLKVNWDTELKSNEAFKKMLMFNCLEHVLIVLSLSCMSPSIFCGSLLYFYLIRTVEMTLGLTWLSFNIVFVITVNQSLVTVLLMVAWVLCLLYSNKEFVLSKNMLRISWILSSTAALPLFVFVISSEPQRIFSVFSPIASILFYEIMFNRVSFICNTKVHEYIFVLTSASFAGLTIAITSVFVTPFILGFQMLFFDTKLFAEDVSKKTTALLAAGFICFMLLDAVKDVTMFNKKDILVEFKKINVDVDNCLKYIEDTRAGKKVFAQSEQDRFLLDVFEGFPPGKFVDLAAAWPKKFSNTYLFETCFNWTGVLIEADPRKIVDLVKERTSPVAPYCIADVEKEVVFGDETVTGINKVHDDTNAKGSMKLTCRPLDAVLSDYTLPKRLDFLSLDIEGYEDMALLSLNKFEFDIIIIEIMHLRKVAEKIENIRVFLNKHGYIPVIGFPTRHKDKLCYSQENKELGNNLWKKESVDSVLTSKMFSRGSGKIQTHDIMFVKNNSKYIPNIEKIFEC